MVKMISFFFANGPVPQCYFALKLIINKNKIFKKIYV